MLSSTYHMNSILKLVPVLSQKLEEMQLVRNFCSSTAKTSTVTPIFYFMILIRKVLFSMRKNWQIVRIELTTGRIAHVQIKSTLERKVKTGAFKGIFLVRKWINNTLKSISVITCITCIMYVSHVSWKNRSHLSSFGLRGAGILPKGK